MRDGSSENPPLGIPPMSISSDEINFLVYRYLQESGFVHSAFTFANESLVAKTSVSSIEIPPGSLITFIQKGLQYINIEAHLNEDGTERPCDAELSLLTPHVCQVGKPKIAPAKPAEPTLNEGSAKKKQKKDAEKSIVESRSLNGADIENSKKRRRDESKAPELSITGAAEDAFVTVLKGHKSEVFSVSWSPTEDKLASGAGDATARIWTMDRTNVAAGVVAADHVSLVHGGGDKSGSCDVTTLDWNHDGQRLATGSYDGKAKIWTCTGSLLHTLAHHKGPIFSLKWSKNSQYILSGSYDKSAIVWDATNGKMKQQFSFHTAPTLDVDWQNEHSFATCSTDKTIKYCTLDSGKPVKTFVGHKDEVNSIEWNPTGNLLASCSDDYTAKVWRTTDDKPVFDFREHTKEIYSIKWSPTGPMTDNPNKKMLLASASFDAFAKLWDTEVGKSICSFKHSDPVYSIAFSPNGELLASGSLRGTLNLWSVKDGHVVKTYKGKGDIFEVSWNSTGDRVAACFSSNTVCVLDLNK